MSVAARRAAARKIKQRYKQGSTRSVADSMAAERRKAAREAAAKGKKK